MSVLIFGKNGQVGRHIVSNLNSEVDFNAFSSSEVNFLNLEEIENCILRYEPKIIINAAAYTKVDLAEEESDKAFKINAEAVAKIAQMTKKINSCLVHYSTDYVFNGDKLEPYNEEDEGCPLSVYGKSKLLGENRILDIGCNYYIFRTSWVISEFSENFLLKMLLLFTKNNPLNIVDDQQGVPTDASFLASNTLKIIKEVDVPYGIYNIVPSGSASWYQLALYIYQEAKKLSEEIIIENDNIFPIKSSDYETLATRPLNSVLNNSKFQSLFMDNIATWETNVDNILNRIYKNK